MFGHRVGPAGPTPRPAYGGLPSPRVASLVPYRVLVQIISLSAEPISPRYELIIERSEPSYKLVQSIKLDPLLASKP
jgi:hypothetical protein